IRVAADEVKGRKTLEQAVVALRTSELPKPIKDVVRIPNGLIVLSMGRGSDQLSVFDQRRSPKQFRPFVLADPLGTNPVSMAGGLLIPSHLGQVHLIDARTGKKKAEPFQTRLVADQKVAWRRPAPVDQNSVVLADGIDKVYRLAVKDQPIPSLAAVAEVTLARPIVSDVAVAGSMVFAVDEDGLLQRLALNDLVADKPLTLDGRVTWGPRVAGQNVFLTTENDQLVCLNSAGEIVWKTPLEHGPLAGPPLPVANDYLLAYANGVLVHVEGASGKELAKLETGRPLGTGPVLLGENVLLVGNDGTLYVSEQPSNSQ
ncbi:MAG: PQQ-binding-like beta-propeller repeat protein, partial [Pirellulales bacterium]|nr:PQQ-binding-like beta-propeller repeat protein [Pirellulales bacterium]